MLKLYMGDIKELHNKYKNVQFTDDIIYELTHNRDGNFYFIYDAKYFKDKEVVKRFQSLVKNYAGLVIGFIDDIDTKTTFYKTFQTYILIIGKKQEKVSLADKVKAYYKNKEIITEIEDSEFMSFLYAVFYSKGKYSSSAGEIINYILEGKIQVSDAKKLFLIFC